MASKRELLNASVDRNKFTWEVIKSFAIGIAAIFSFLANQNSAAAQRNVELARTDVERARAEVERLKAESDQRTQQSQSDVKAYELVEKTLSGFPAFREGQWFATVAMLNALTKPPLLNELQNALLTVECSELADRVRKRCEEFLKKLEAAQQFDIDSALPNNAEAPPAAGRSRSEPVSGLTPASWVGQALVPVLRAQGSGVLKGYQLDIFYCEGVSQSLTAARKTRADQAAGRLKNSPLSGVRVRLLPSLVQARPGYRSFADEVRYGGSSERQAASELARLLGLKPESLKLVATATPKYLSAFYCT
jgi:hypothetical protein